jgi:hypothetical protein
VRYAPKLEETVEHHTNGSTLINDINAWFALRIKKLPIISEIISQCPAVIMMYKSGSLRGSSMEVRDGICLNFY